jgi:hypothetical protein
MPCAPSGSNTNRRRRKRRRRRKISDVFIVVNVKKGVFWDVTPCGGSERRS